MPRLGFAAIPSILNVPSPWTVVVAMTVGWPPLATAVDGSSAATVHDTVTMSPRGGTFMSTTVPETENVSTVVSPPLESLPLPLHAVAITTTQSHRVGIMGASSGSAVSRTPRGCHFGARQRQGAVLSAGSGTATTSMLASTDFFQVPSWIDIASVTSWQARSSHGVSAFPFTSSS